MPVAVIDFDDTLCTWNGKFDGTFGEPIEGAAEALQRLEDEGWEIVIHSCRIAAEATNQCDLPYEKTPSQKIEAIQNLADWLMDYDIPYHQIWTHDKPYGDVYIDDRAIRFEGDWGETLNAILRRS